jgi:hypothetical protein
MKCKVHGFVFIDDHELAIVTDSTGTPGVMSTPSGWLKEQLGATKANVLEETIGDDTPLVLGFISEEGEEVTVPDHKLRVEDVPEFDDTDSITHNGGSV